MIFKAIAKHVGKKALKGVKNMMTPSINSMKKLASKKSTDISFKPKPLSGNTNQKYDYLYKTSKHRNKAADAYDKATPGWYEKTYGKKTLAQRKESTNFVQTQSKILNESNRILSKGGPFNASGRKVVGGKKQYVAGESGAIDGSSFSIAPRKPVNKAIKKTKKKGK
jgi:hypothetical protein